MPYIVTTKRPQPWLGPTPNMPASVSPRAVATLEEAQEDVIAPVLDGALPGSGISHDRAREFYMQMGSLPESGGTVGPLPDGTVIEVEAIEPRELRKRAGMDHSATRMTMKVVDICDAYNARQS